MMYQGTMMSDVHGRQNRQPIEDMVKSSADPPMTLYDQLKLSRLQAHQKMVGPGHRKVHSEFNIAALSTSIIVEDIGSGAVEEPSPHPFFRKNAEWEPHMATSPTSTAVVPGQFDSMMQSLSIDPDRRRAKNHRRNKTELPVSFTSAPSTTADPITSPFKSNTLALDEDDLRKLVRQLESIIESQAEEIEHLQHEIDELKARAQAHQQ
jgi:hypothetical protein